MSAIWSELSRGAEWLVTSARITHFITYISAACAFRDSREFGPWTNLNRFMTLVYMHVSDTLMGYPE